ncbi:MAG TPA: crosslink repair DNA glycosylase YcaQ family protein, partial [Dehalococcoidia bacterium]|nr:crosslink repair DNA glycosylase YcaQ family protein [Dehalococcoidia bacterium]
RTHARDTTEPSPFCHEILNVKPYAFLDDAPLEERRARAVSLRRVLPESARDLGVLDKDAIERVLEEARTEPRDAEELHDLLTSSVSLPQAEGKPWSELFDELVASGRAATIRVENSSFWFAAENLPLIEALYPGGEVRPAVRLPPHLDPVRPLPEEAALALLRGHLEYLGPVTVQGLSLRCGISPSAVVSALATLEGEGLVLRGHFTPGEEEEEFCNRRLLARIHRYTLDRLRREIEPVSAQDLMRFLLQWQHLTGGSQLEGKSGLLQAIKQLQGFEIAVAAWERHILPGRVPDYRPSWLDELCLSGEATWARLNAPGAGNNGSFSFTMPSGSAPVSLVLRSELRWLLAAVRNGAVPPLPTAGASAEVWEALNQEGALFFEDIVDAGSRLATEVEQALWELVARGLVTADGFQALRSLLTKKNRRVQTSLRRRAPFSVRRFGSGLTAGRWSLLPRKVLEMDTEELAGAWAEQLLNRYGIVFKDLLARESFAIPWREVLRALRRLEARGLIRGGRFVSGFLGEQYALPEAVEQLRRTRRRETNGEIVRVNATDPLNLVGIVLPGPRIPSKIGNAVLYCDGIAIASEEGRKIVPRAAGAEALLDSLREERLRQRLAYSTSHR